MLQAITVSDRSGIKLIQITYDQIDMFNIIEIVSELESLLETSTDLLFDFSNIKFIDSSGLGGLIKMQKLLQKKGGKLGLCNLSRNVENLLRLTQTLKFLPKFDSIEEGIKKLPDVEIPF